MMILLFSIASEGKGRGGIATERGWRDKKTLRQKILEIREEEINILYPI